MAASTFVLKCKTEKGLHILNDLDGNSTVANLKSELQRLTKISVSTMKILCGYPPQPLNVVNDDLKLNDANIHSGDSIIIEILKVRKIEAAYSQATILRGNDQINSYDLENNHGAPVNSPVPPVSDFIPLKISLDGLAFQQSGIMMRHVVPSNNSCLFTSVVFILSNGQIDAEKSDELRQIIVNTVEKNPLKYNEAYLGMANNEYCSWIIDKNHWGGAIELAILSEHFKLEIVAVDTLSLKMHRFGETSNYKNRFFLIYDGIHYDPLVWELETDMQTIFPVSETKPMEMAFEIAKEAKSSHQFTDVANFTLCCEVCKTKMRGEKEAREHAKNTGHVEFGEL